MPSHETVIYILSPKGLYPNRSVVCEGIAYVVHNGIPLLAEPLPEDPINWWVSLVMQKSPLTVIENSPPH